MYHLCTEYAIANALSEGLDVVKETPLTLCIDWDQHEERVVSDLVAAYLHDHKTGPWKQIAQWRSKSDHMHEVWTSAAEDHTTVYEMTVEEKSHLRLLLGSDAKREIHILLGHSPSLLFRPVRAREARDEEKQLEDAGLIYRRAGID